MEHTNDKPFWGLGEVLALAWPAGLSMLNSTIMMFVDGMMVARIGPGPLSAQFVGGILAFMPTCLALGTLTVVNTFVSQNLGAGRTRRCGQYTWAGMLLAVVLGLMFQSLHLAGRPIVALMGHDAPVQELELVYFHYMLAGVGLFLAGRVLEQFFFGIGRSKIVLVASAVGNIFNVLANYVLIFGKLGFPAMGLEGAAIGTLAGSALLLVILLSVFMCGPMHRRFATRDVKSLRMGDCRQIVKIGYPAGVQFFNDILSWGLLNAALIGMFGTVHLAANTAAIRFISMSFMPAVGIGIATTALVGRYIGLGRFDLARRRAHAAALAAMVYMGLCALVFWLWRYELVGFYLKFAPAGGAPSPQTAAMADQIVRIGARLLLCAAVFQIFDAIAIVFTGALRGAGDTFWPMVLTFVLSWSIQVGGGVLLVVFMPQLKSLGPWISVGAYVAVLGVMLAWRFESGAWRKIDLLKRPARPPVPQADSILEA